MEDTMQPLPPLSETEGLPADVMDLVHAALATDEALPEQARSWVPDGTGSAEWAMQKLVTAQRRLLAVREQAAAWRQQIDAWEAAESKTDIHTEEFFHGVLAEWGRRSRLADPGKATLRLPSGEVATTERKAAAEVTDAEALVTWCKKNRPEVVQTTVTEKVPAAEAKKLGSVRESTAVTPGDDTVQVHRVFVTDDGEAVPGMAVKPPEVKVTVRTAWS